MGTAAARPWRSLRPMDWNACSGLADFSCAACPPPFAVFLSSDAEADAFFCFVELMADFRDFYVQSLDNR